MFGQAVVWWTSVEVCASKALESKFPHDASLVTDMNTQHHDPKTLRRHTMFHHQNVPRDLKLRSSVSCLVLEQVQRNAQGMNKIVMVRSFIVDLSKVSLHGWRHTQVPSNESHSQSCSTQAMYWCWDHTCNTCSCQSSGKQDITWVCPFFLSPTCISSESVQDQDQVAWLSKIIFLDLSAISSPQGKTYTSSVSKRLVNDW